MFQLFQKLLKILLEKIGFKGILMSDDISMKALKYDLITNAKKSLMAGCNLVLYCAGEIKDNFKLIKAVYIDKFTIKNSEIYKILKIITIKILIKYLLIYQIIAAL